MSLFEEKEKCDVSRPLYVSVSARQVPDKIPKGALEEFMGL